MKKRFGVETEPYKLCHKYNMNVIYVGDRFHPVPKKSFCYSLFVLCNLIFYLKNLPFTITSVVISAMIIVRSITNGIPSGLVANGSPTTFIP